MFHSKKRAQRRRKTQVAVAVLVLAASLVLSDVLLEGVRRFWVDHAMITGLVAFGVTLAITILVVDEIIRHREIERWLFIGGLAMRKLSGEAFKVCTTLIQAVSHERFADDLARAFDNFGSNGQRPGHEAPPLLPEGFEESLATILEDQAARELLFEGVIDLCNELEAAIAHWAPVMLRAPDLTDAFNLFGMMRVTLGWFAGSLDRVDESSQDRLDLWSNLRVYLALVASFDTARRDALNEPVFFGLSIDEHDRTWGLPFEAQRVALEAHAAR